MRTFAQKQNQPQERVSSSLARSNMAASGASHRAHPILHLQGTIGNQVVQRLLHASREGIEAESSTTALSRFLHDFSRIPVYSKVPVKTQTRQTATVSEEQQASASTFDPGKIMLHAPSRRGNSFTSLTTGDDDEGMFQTAVGDIGTAPSNSFNTQLLEPGESTPGPIVGPVGSHHCVPTVVKSNLPSGHIAATVSGGRFAAPFDMTADFDTPIPCNGICGEYRQFVSGFSQVNGTDIVHPLCSNNMSRTTEHEDCLSSGGTNLKYGYHSIPFSTSRFTNPDQATGWSYRGHDAPGFNLAAFGSGTVLNWKLSFRGELVDACDGDRSLQPSATWTAGGSHTVP